MPKFIWRQCKACKCISCKVAAYKCCSSIVTEQGRTVERNEKKIEFYTKKYVFYFIWLTSLGTHFNALVPLIKAQIVACVNSRKKSSTKYLSNVTQESRGYVSAFFVFCFVFERYTVTYTVNAALRLRPLRVKRGSVCETVRSVHGDLSPHTSAPLLR